MDFPIVFSIFSKRLQWVFPQNGSCRDGCLAYINIVCLATDARPEATLCALYIRWIFNNCEIINFCAGLRPYCYVLILMCLCCFYFQIIGIVHLWSSFVVLSMPMGIFRHLPEPIKKEKCLKPSNEKKGRSRQTNEIFKGSWIDVSLTSNSNNYLIKKSIYFYEHMSYVFNKVYNMLFNGHC